MPGGHIFHGDLDWPWASNRARLDTPAQAVGRADRRRRRCCSAASGARRGGAVSGLGGHNAAQAVLASPVSAVSRFFSAWRPLVTFYSLHSTRH